MDTELTGPVEVGGSAEFPTEGLWDVHGDFYVQLTYRKGPPIIVAASRYTPHGITFEGSKGTLFVNRGKLTADPASILNAVIGPGDEQVYRSRDHKGNLLDCVKTRRETCTPVEVGHRSGSACILTHIGMKLQRPLVWDPVCGCDGETYGNPCEAAMAGVNVDHEGECAPPSCAANADCDADDYCAKDEGDCDGQGACEPKPVACPHVWDPVCGCDGRTYGNPCVAAAAGVNVRHQGACAGSSHSPADTRPRYGETAPSRSPGRPGTTRGTMSSWALSCGAWCCGQSGTAPVAREYSMPGCTTTRGARDGTARSAVV